MPFDPTIQAVQQHQVPQWFHDAKLGIFIHWGLYSVPGWAPTTGPLHDVVASEGWQGWFRRNPYAEWYMNSLRVPGSVTAEYHNEQFGDKTYGDFANDFKAATASWDASTWADLFAQAGAKYVVLTTKHHDGFLLWPSEQPNPFIADYQVQRDLVGELSDAVRAKGLTMGLYYSGGLDWTFNTHVIADISDLFQAVPQSADYVAYADAHWRELTRRYRPACMWNDIGYPVGSDIGALFADYYNAVPEGVINDRFTQAGPDQIAQISQGMLPKPAHSDYRTPEYAVFDTIQPDKWESCRGLGFSFGYNRNESVNDMLSPVELIRSFVDIVSKNGNLLINVGPRGDGSIPAEQAERLLALGAWLAINGEAIYATRPWSRAEGSTDSGLSIRFTSREHTLYATIFGVPRGPITIADLPISDHSIITLLGHEGALEWQRTETGITVTCPNHLADAAAYTLRITPLTI
jgi:alpha-L-fucosidase